MRHIQHPLRTALPLLMTVPILWAAAVQGSIIVDRTTNYGNGADTYANNQDAATRGQNYGAEASFMVHENGSNRYRIGYLRFDLTDLPSGMSAADTSAASLKLTWTGSHGSSSATASFQLWGLVDGSAADHLTTGWNETGLTWNNAPARNGTISFATDSSGQTGTPTGYAQLLGGFSFNSVSANQTISIGDGASGVTMGAGLNDALIDFLQSDTNGAVTFMLIRVSDTSQFVTFHTKENQALLVDGSDPDPENWIWANNTAYNPTLQMTLVPEPASLALMAAGALLMLPRRRTH